MNYIESVKFLYGLQKFGMKFGLEGIQLLLDSLDRPEKKFLSVHIAGTNGKGSTASMLAAIFTAAGYKTGLYTSPHLVNFNERIRINGLPISSRIVAKLTSAIHSEVKRNKNTFFEAVTAIAFKYFADSNIDIAIVETGLGGKLDATNVLKPIVTIITAIGLEHTQVLGTSIGKIAAEKGGIIKHGIPCVAGIMPEKARKVISNICREKQSKLIQVNQKQIRIKGSSLEGLTVGFKNIERDLNISLAGEYQARNALLAVTAVDLITRAKRFKIDIKAISRGLKNIQKYSGLNARLSVIRRKPLIITDVAHNPAAMVELCLSLKHLNLKKMHVIVGIMRDKDYKKIVLILRQIAERVFLVEARTDRTRSAKQLAAEFRRYGLIAKDFDSVKDGVDTVLRQHDGVPILITGSHFVVGEALAFINKEKYLTINQ